MICARSSLFYRHGLVVVEGRIDNGYTGELFATVYHPGLEHPDGRHFGIAWLENGERIAQLVLIPFRAPAVRWVTDLPKTDRGTDGLGSTGTR